MPLEVLLIWQFLRSAIIKNFFMKYKLHQCGYLLLAVTFFPLAWSSYLSLPGVSIRAFHGRWGMPGLTGDAPGHR